MRTPSWLKFNERGLSMKQCRTCTNNIFDLVWDDHRCMARGRRIYGLDKITDCELYEELGNKEDNDHESIDR